MKTKPTDPTATYAQEIARLIQCGKIAKFGASTGGDPKHTRRVSSANSRCTKRGVVIIILRNEEDWARFQRRLVHDLPDNQVEDELARLKFLETGKMTVTDIQFTRMACRAAAKDVPERETNDTRRN